MAPSQRLNSGTTRTINGNSGIGGVSSSSGGASSSRLSSFQNRGALTKLSSSSTSASLLAGGSGRSSVPRPVNTSSLRKENGGQDISAVLVNRHGGKKLGWGSSLQDKTPPPPETNTPAPTNINNTSTNDVLSITRMSHRRGLGRTSRNSALDPTPEEALAASEAETSKKLSTSTSLAQQQEPTDTSPTTAAAPASQNTPWALHAPTPQPRDPITGMAPAEIPHDGRGGVGGGAHSYTRPSDSQHSRYNNVHNQQYNNHQSSSSNYHNQDYQDGGRGGGGGSHNYRQHDGSSTRYSDNYHNQYQNNHRVTRDRYGERDTSAGSYDRHSQYQHQSNSYENHRDNRYDNRSNYEQRRYDDRGGDDGRGGYHRGDRRERYNQQYPQTAGGGGVIDQPNSYRDRQSYRNDGDNRSAGASGQHYNNNQYRRSREGEEGYNNPTQAPSEVNDTSGDAGVPPIHGGSSSSSSSRVQRDTTRRGDAGGDHERDVTQQSYSSSGGGYDPRYDRHSVSSSRDYNRHTNHQRYQRDVNSGRGEGYERKNDYGHRQGIGSPVVEEEHEDDDGEDNGNNRPPFEGDAGQNTKEGGIEHDDVVGEEDKDLSEGSENDVREEESEDDAPRQILRHNTRSVSSSNSAGKEESCRDRAAEVVSEKDTTPSSDRLIAVEEETQQSPAVIPISRREIEATSANQHQPSPDKSLFSLDGISLDTKSFDDRDAQSDDDDDLSDGTLDPVHEIRMVEGVEEEKLEIAAASAVATNTRSDVYLNPVIDRNLVIKQQQQNVLKKVEAARKERKRGSVGTNDEDSSKALIGHQQQQVGESAVSNTPPSSSHDSKNDRAPVATTIQLSEEDQMVREAFKKDYLVKWAAECEARIEHRRTRNPRTRGVLFRYLEDGSLMNADLSEREVAKRLERKMKKEARNRKLASSSSSSLPLGKVNVSTTPSKSLIPSKQEGKHGKYNSNVESSPSSAIVEEDEPPIVVSSPPEETIKETKPYVPSPGPSVSAWIAGPPPGMVKNQTEEQEKVEPHSIVSPSPLEKKNTHHNHKRNSNNNTSAVVEDVASKLDRVLSSNLLDIANSASWSSNPNTAGNSTAKQQTKVAVGPIMSNWTAFAGSQVEYPYQSFGDSSAKPPSNTTNGRIDGEEGEGGSTSASPPPGSIPGTVGAGADWSMDFALPHDLLSSTAENEDREAPATNTMMAVSESAEIKNKERKPFNPSKSGSRYKGRRKPPYNQQRSTNSGPSSTKKKNHTSKSNDSNTKKNKSSSRRPGLKSKKVGVGAMKKKDNRDGGSRSGGNVAQPQPQT